MNFSSKEFILVGFVLVLAGAVLPLLIVLKVLPSTLLLNFLAYTASVAGLFLGLIGAATYIRERRPPQDK